MGKSGMGCYHGVEGFRNFSHRCPVYDFKQVGLLGKVWKVVGPNITLPYSESDVAEIKKFLAPLPPIGSILAGLKLMVGAAVVAIGCQTALRSSALRATLVGLLKAGIRALEEP